MPHIASTQASWTIHAIAQLGPRVLDSGWRRCVCPTRLANKHGSGIPPRRSAETTLGAGGRGSWGCPRLRQGGEAATHLQAFGAQLSLSTSPWLGRRRGAHHPAPSLNGRNRSGWGWRGSQAYWTNTPALREFKGASPCLESPLFSHDKRTGWGNLGLKRDDSVGCSGQMTRVYSFIIFFLPGQPSLATSAFHSCKGVSPPSLYFMK